RYVIEGLPAGEVLVRASYPGHAPVELLVELPAGGPVAVDLELLAQPITLSPLRVERLREDGDVPEASGRNPTSGSALSEIEMQPLDLSPGVAQAGLVDAIGGMGGNDPADPT